jgi:hypothetical protein
MPVFRYLSSGLGEMGIFRIIYLIGDRLITRSFERTLIFLLLGYSFAYVIVIVGLSLVQIV